MNSSELIQAAIARLSHGLDSVEWELSVGAFLLRLWLLTSLSISHSQSLSVSPPDFATLYSLILHLTRLENWTRSYRQCRPVLRRQQKGVPIITTGSPKSREYGDPGMPIFTGCINFYDTGHDMPAGLASLTQFLCCASHNSAMEMPRVLSFAHAISMTSVQRVLDQPVCNMLVYYSQAWLTVPVYACVFLFVITHRSTVLNINQ